MADQDLFEKTLNELSKFIQGCKGDGEFLVEYSKALFYLANLTGKQQMIKETDMILWAFSSLINKNPDNEQIRIIFAYLLSNLVYDFSSSGEFGGARTTLESLRSLMEKSSNTFEVKLIYTEALLSICSRLARDGKFDDLSNYLNID